MKKLLLLCLLVYTTSNTLLATRTDVATTSVSDAVNNIGNVGISASSSTFTFAPGDSLVYAVEVPSFVPTTGINSTADTALFYIRMNCKMLTTEGEISITSTDDMDAAVYTIASASSKNEWPVGTAKADSTALVEGKTQEIILVNTGTVEVQINYITLLTTKVALISDAPANTLERRGLILAPNPVTDVLNISLPEDIETMQLSLRSVEGTLLKNIYLNESAPVDLSGYKAGVYFLLDEETGAYQKIMLQ